MNTFSPPHRPGFLLLPLLLVLTLTTGCFGNKHVLEFDNRFSMNLIKVPLWFPDEKTELTPGQEETLQRRGRPDFIHFWWRPDGSLITTADLTGKSAEMPTMLQETKKSWIYMGNKEEIVFENDGSYRIQPISEVLELICKYGDPSHKREPKIIEGRRHETWQWMEHGLQVMLIDGQVDKTSYFPASGQGTWGLK